MKIKYNVVDPVSKKIHLTTLDFQKAADYVTNHNQHKKSFKVIIIKTRWN